MDRYLFNLGKDDAEQNKEIRSDDPSYLKGYNETRAILNRQNERFKIKGE